MASTRKKLDNYLCFLQQSQVVSRDATKVVQIPSLSFSAFRLLYATPTEVSHLDSTIFLGRVPDTWFKLSNKQDLLSHSKKLGYSAKEWISATYSRSKSRVSKSRSFGSMNIVKSESTASHRDTYEQDASSKAWNETSSDSLQSQIVIGGKGANASETAISSNLTDAISIDSEAFDEMLYGTIPDSSRRSFHNDNGPPHSLDINYTGEPGFIQSRSHTPYNSGEAFTVSSQQTNGINRLSFQGKLQQNLNGVDLVGVCPENTMDNLKYSVWPDKKPSCETKISNDLETDEIHNKDVLGYELYSADPQLAGPIRKLPRTNIEDHDERLENLSEFEPASVDMEIKKPKVQFVDRHSREQVTSESLQPEYVVAKRDYYRVMRKMQSLARKSKGKAQLGGSRLKLKIIDSMLLKSKAGEIVRVDKMLIMIRKTSNVSAILSFTERSSFDSTIQDNWREYFVVLRNTGSRLHPLCAQLFDKNGGKNFGIKPIHSFYIDESLRADFFSYTDKTISITSPVDDGLRVFIMNAKYTAAAFSWLYMIKEVSKKDFISTLNIEFPIEKLQIKLDIPPALVKKAFAGSEFVELHEEPFGYEVKFDMLYTFLNTSIVTQLREAANLTHTSFDWLERNPNPAFCFKFYDRIEWIPKDGKSLIFQSQLLRENARLEYKQVTKVPLSITSSNGQAIARPISIEGFLTRITNITGKEVSKFRAFYKIQYFFTSENILFFSSILKGLPPSPRNKLLKKGVDREQVCKSLPNIYIRNPFELDDCGHIKWLKDENFQKYDDEAAEEFSRKIRHIVGAKAMVDICMISSVKPIPFESIQARHLYFQLYLWYSSPITMNDMSIMDSGFEIELFDGKNLKLLAPLRQIRNEWVERLKLLAMYWRTHLARISKAETACKLQNIEHLRLSDFVDSNLPFGHDSLEIKKSFANNLAYTTSGIAMSTCILCSGYLYQKQKKHSNFSRYYVVLCPGYILIYSLFKRSKSTGARRDTPYYERYMTVPLSECYVYSGSSSQLDLVGSQKLKSPGECDLPRVYPDGWRSSEEDHMRCFSIWFGGKRTLRHGACRLKSSDMHGGNPGLVHMAYKLGFTGKILVFLARSRQEREHWVHHISQEINRFSEGERTALV